MFSFLIPAGVAAPDSTLKYLKIRQGHTSRVRDKGVAVGDVEVEVEVEVAAARDMGAHDPLVVLWWMIGRAGGLVVVEVK